MRRSILTFLLLAAFPAMAEQLPEPPVPPARVPGPDVAPRPNLDTRLATDAPAQRAGVEFKVFQPVPAVSGYAFAPGSRFRTPEERKPLQAPGINFTVPID